MAEDTNLIGEALFGVWAVVRFVNPAVKAEVNSRAESVFDFEHEGGIKNCRFLSTIADFSPDASSGAF